jgi:hypothetical protein
MNALLEGRMCASKRGARQKGAQGSPPRSPKCFLPKPRPDRPTPPHTRCFHISYPTDPAPSAMEPGVAQLAEVFARTVANDRVSGRAAPRGAMGSHAGAPGNAPAHRRVARAPQEVIKSAEEQLKSVSQQPGYGITVLKVRGRLGRARAEGGALARRGGGRRAPHAMRAGPPRAALPHHAPCACEGGGTPQPSWPPPRRAPTPAAPTPWPGRGRGRRARPRRAAGGGRKFQKPGQVQMGASPRDNGGSVGGREAGAGLACCTLHAARRHGKAGVNPASLPEPPCRCRPRWRRSRGRCLCRMPKRSACCGGAGEGARRRGGVCTVRASERRQAAREAAGRLRATPPSPCRTVPPCRRSKSGSC